ncbi:MAG: hypothetical protein ACRD4E_00055, partial [Bryobacteraceae bacterium]
MDRIYSISLYHGRVGGTRESGFRAVSGTADLHRTANATPRRFRIWNHLTMFYGKQYAAGR